MKSGRVLGIESSCDETGVALVEMWPTGVPRLLAHAQRFYRLLRVP